MFIAKITHSPFDEPFVCAENCTEVSTITSEGLNYLQFCSLIGQTIFAFGYSTIEITFEADKP